jgi:ketosteroid isomerase-like protein
LHGYGVPVSLANVELVKRCLAARGPGTYSEASALFDPNLVVDLSARPDGRIYHGRREALEAMQVWVAHWDYYRYQAEAFFDAGDRVVVFYREHGRGKESRAATELAGALLCLTHFGRANSARLRPVPPKSVAINRRPSTYVSNLQEDFVSSAVPSAPVKRRRGTQSAS